MTCSAGPRSGAKPSRARRRTCLLGANHKRTRAVGDRLVADERRAAGESDAAGQLGAFAPGDHALAAKSGPQIVYSQVERRQRHELADRRPHRRPAGGVDQAGDRSRGEDAALRHFDQLLAPRPPELGPIVSRRAKFHAQGTTMADAPRELEEAGGIESLAVRRRRHVVHAASRWAVSRTKAIMLGMPWVRFALSCRDRSNGASAAATSIRAT